ncbi:myb-related Hv1-like [Chlorella sorokiniana]|uniref:Myb-related Hv1-like n=1 Tax=Chlorella sorokiniana TaxID=3076 RepID=A0A2P6TQY9_CHLSO|nr:myb-related Hv1-like [Chlorella sorokiniana]|eukprot:PRW56480.1 myb-related Hv1-like [Chlorella sorokiniana]
MAEVIGPGGQRIKFASTRTGGLQLMQPLPQPLVQLSELMQRLEATGMVPILDDGLVGGNCGCTAALCGLDRSSSSDGMDSCSSDGGGSVADDGSRSKERSA